MHDVLGALLYWSFRQEERGEELSECIPTHSPPKRPSMLTCPTYPENLFIFLSSTVASREVAWDYATGNGQAATHLAGYFGRVIATDESAEMIAQAPRVPKLEYRVVEAEDSGIAARSVDLVTVASAIHWFDLRKFYAEVRRVVKPGGGYRSLDLLYPRL